MMGWATILGLWFLVVSNGPERAHGSSRGLNRRRPNVDPDPKGLGICATAVTLRDYKCIEDSVTTEDGFIISLQRIAEGGDGSEKKGTLNKQPVIFQHGVTIDGMTWFMTSPEQSLTTILADNGYDVWIANTRGTRYSRRHTTLKPTDKAFWDWSWDELVTYELPAILGHVYNKTGKKAHYVGHSLGTTLALAALSQRKFVDLMKSVVLLSPIAYTSNVKSLLCNLAARTLLAEGLQLLGFPEFNLVQEPISSLVQKLCSAPGIDCFDILTVIFGPNCCVKSSTAETFLKYEPQPTSTKNMIHLAQTVRSGVVTKFDYEIPAENMKHYGNIHPPVYNFSNIPNDFPIMIGYGGKDALADTLDVEKLLDDLKHHDKDKLPVLFIENYNHLDYLWAINVKHDVYDSVLSFLRRHQ